MPASSAHFNTKHGGASRGAHSKEYDSWSAMIRRCELPSQRSYKDYGARGIKVCAAWRADFAAFLRDVGPAPSPGHTIERNEVNGDYEPGNVRWATAKEQSNNRRSSVRVEVAGESLTVAQWAERSGIKYQTLWARLFVRGMSPERALALGANANRHAPEVIAHSRAPEVK